MINLRWDENSEKKLFKNLEDVFDNIKDGAMRGVFEGASHLRMAANLTYTPMDTTALASTSYTTSVKAKNPTAEAVWIEDYAISVHEDLQKRHGREFNTFYARDIALGIEHSRKDTEQAKFVERPLFEERFTIFNIIADWITV